MWPRPSPPSTFVERRRRLEAGLERPAVLVAGFRQARNFQANTLPLRCGSHFLYFVGRPLEAAVLVAEPGRSRLFARKPDPEEELWTGRMPTLDELAETCGLAVLPLEELSIPDGAMTVPAQDWAGALQQSELLGREIEPGTGDDLAEQDVALAELLIELRLEHDDAAIAQLRQAAAATALAHQAGLNATRVGLRESNVRAAMEAAFRAWGYSAAYEPIVTTQGQVLHATRQDGSLDPGELLLADVGAETPEGWAGDVTRTWPVAAHFSPTQRALYEVVLAAQKAALEQVRPGTRFLDVHRAAGRALTEGLVALGILRGDPAELYELGAAALFFPHGVGHLLGLDVHDLEDLGDRAGYAPGRVRAASPGDRYLRLDRDLAPRMAVTIEPGFYRIERILGQPDEVGALEEHLDRGELEKFRDVRGIRIEDDVLVTADGHELLTAAIPKSIPEIESARSG